MPWRQRNRRTIDEAAKNSQLYRRPPTGPTGLCNRNHHGQPETVKLFREAGGVAISSVGDSVGVAGDWIPEALIPEAHLALKVTPHWGTQIQLLLIVGSIEGYRSGCLGSTGRTWRGALVMGLSVHEAALSPCEGSEFPAFQNRSHKVSHLSRFFILSI